jgi:hypothetical protein
MNQEHEEILEAIKLYLEKNPTERFGQALFNLDINQFANSKQPEELRHLLRDIYNDQDEAILKRISDRIDFFDKKQ